MYCNLTSKKTLTYGDPQLVPLVAADAVVVEDAAVVEGFGVIHFGVNTVSKPLKARNTDDTGKRDRKNKQITAGADLRISLFC